MRHITIGVLWFAMARRASVLKFYLRSIGKDFFKREVPFISSAIAFNILLCFIPLLLVLLSIIGTMLLSYDVPARDVGKFLDTVIPNLPYRRSIKDVVVTIVTDMMANRSSMGMLGVGLLLYTATSLFSALRSGLHHAVGAPAPTDLLHSQVKDIVIVFSLGVLFVVVAIVSQAYPLTKFFADASAHSFIPGLPLILASIGLFAFSVFTMYFLYQFIPSYKTSHTGSFIAALSAAVMWEISNRIFSWYIYSYQPFGKVYGAYAFMLAAMIWAYTVSIIFIVGGMAGHLYTERKKGTFKIAKPKSDPPPAKQTKEPHRP
ncbi:MAG TPA: YihY/virulence factor BrkB family protein [Bacteroidota bacterium]|nr:YihY/virulence factor BrkB family protein [Bacteroidota bacterium]